jgi:PAS domain S-box-containing protein
LAKCVPISDYQTRDAGIPCQYTEVAEIDGEEIWLEVFKTPLYDGSGEFQGIVGCSRDVTQRQLAEEALRESEQNFRSLFETIQDCIFIIDETGTIVEVNDEVVRRLGYSKNELLGAHPLQFRPLDQQSKAKEVLSKVLKGEADFCDIPIVAKDGTLVQVETKVTKGHWGNREVFFGISRDTTDRKQAEEKLREEYSFRKAIIERAAEGLCVCHATAEYPYAKFTVWNDRMIEITGYSLEEINRLGWYQTVYPDPETREKARLRMERMRQGNDLHSEEWEIIRADGEKRILNISTSQLIISDNIVHIMALMLDVTERQQAEEALKKSHLELEHRVAERTAQLTKTNQELRSEVAERMLAEDELHQYKDQLEQLVEERTGELLKVNQRLRSLGSELTLAEERERRRLAVELHDQIGQLLALAKIKLGEGLLKSPINTSTHAVREARELIDQVIQFTRSLTFELSLTVLYELGLGAAIEWLAEQSQQQYGLQVKVIREGDEQHLHEAGRVLLFRIVRELLTNVLKHAQANQVLITLQNTGEHIHLQVADDGIGFDRPKESMFSGFGLFNIQERLSDLGGYLDLETMPGKGTSAAIVVPVEKVSKSAGEK